MIIHLISFAIDQYLLICFFSLNHLKKIFYIYFVSIISILNCLAGLGCSRTFCGAYWTAQGLDARQFNVICPEETFKPVWMFLLKLSFILFIFLLMEVYLRCSLLNVVSDYSIILFAMWKVKKNQVVYCDTLSKMFVLAVYIVEWENFFGLRILLVSISWGQFIWFIFISAMWE